jgi:hypothetical protein
MCFNRVLTLFERSLASPNSLPMESICWGCDPNAVCASHKSNQLSFSPQVPLVLRPPSSSLETTSLPSPASPSILPSLGHPRYLRMVHIPNHLSRHPCDSCLDPTTSSTRRNVPLSRLGCGLDSSAGSSRSGRGGARLVLHGMRTYP